MGVFLSFQLAALVPVAGVGVALNARYRQQQTSETLRDAESQADFLANLVIAPRLDAADLMQADTAQSQISLATVLANPATRRLALRVKVWDSTGRVVASDDTGLVGQSFPVDDDLQAAISGTVHAEVSDLDNAENVEDHIGSKAVEVYTPLRDQAGTQIGVLEVYIPYGELSFDLQHATDSLREQMMAALVILFVLLSAATWPVLRRLRRHAIDAQHQAIADPLTGLPNRRGFDEWLTWHAATGQGATIVMADLTAFGAVNDALGLDGGDDLLVAVSVLLEKAVPTGVIARVGADDFAVLIPDEDGSVMDAIAVDDLLRGLSRAVAVEVTAAGVPLTPLVSLGAVRFPEHGTDPRALMQRVESALAKAQATTAGIAVYDAADDPFDPDQLQLLVEIRRAAQDDQLVLHYQPQCDAQSGRVVGVEALVRWQHPERGLLSPIAFLPIAEKTGLVGDITRWVLRQAAQQLATWRGEGIDLVMSVNISARDLSDPGFAVFALDTVLRAGVPASSVCLELTETALVVDASRAQTVLQDLAAAGFRLSLDDFGQGFTSLGQLRDLPLHEIKLDRAFVDGMARSDADRAIVATVVMLAHSLRLSVVAEGVETAEQLAALQAAGYDVVQGWHLGRPAPAEALTGLVRLAADTVLT